MNLTFILCVLTALAAAAEPASPTVPAANTPWTHPLTHKRKLNSPLVEVTPFVFKERFYLLENWQKQWGFPGVPSSSAYEK